MKIELVDGGLNGVVFVQDCHFHCLVILSAPFSMLKLEMK